MLRITQLHDFCRYLGVASGGQRARGASAVGVLGLGAGPGEREKDLPRERSRGREAGVTQPRLVMTCFMRV